MRIVSLHPVFRSRKAGVADALCCVYALLAWMWSRLVTASLRSFTTPGRQTTDELTA